jgi:hypothetical protein
MDHPTYCMLNEA